MRTTSVAVAVLASMALSTMASPTIRDSEMDIKPQASDAYECSDVMCMMHCEEGFKQDEFGCDICECVEPEEHKCPEAMCTMYCEEGFQQDGFGCDICKCVEPEEHKCSDV
ncbi:hypothetical protein SARC_07192, partial [Sphaeroforma arctica JP610]